MWPEPAMRLIIAVIAVFGASMAGGSACGQCLQDKLMDPDGIEDDWYGISVSVSGNWALVGAPGAPDGEYVVIQYEASFENKASAVETITPMLDKDGQWRVSGYFMK